MLDNVCSRFHHADQHLPAPHFVEACFRNQLLRHAARLGALAGFFYWKPDRRHPYFHLTMETRVPSPTFDQISNSCDSRFAPLSPKPIPLPEV